MENKSYQSGIIIENTEIAPSIYKMTLEGDFQGEAGQFYMVRAWDMYPLLSRPFSICNLEEGKLTFLYQVVGEGTQLFADLEVTSEVSVLGPLGKGFPIIENKKTALVAGGIGLAPMQYLARQLDKPDLYVGYSCPPYFIEEMRPYVGEIHITTDDGNAGTKGYVTDILPKTYELIYACGPTPMLGALKALNLKADVYVSLEAHMGCGIGACAGCTCQTQKGYERICVEGPVFNEKEVQAYA